MAGPHLNTLDDVLRAVDEFLAAFEALPPPVRAWLRAVEAELADVQFRVQASRRRHADALAEQLGS